MRLLEKVLFFPQGVDAVFSVTIADVSDPLVTIFVVVHEFLVLTYEGRSPYYQFC